MTFSFWSILKLNLKSTQTSKVGCESAVFLICLFSFGFSYAAVVADHCCPLVWWLMSSLARFGVKPSVARCTNGSYLIQGGIIRWCFWSIDYISIDSLSMENPPLTSRLLADNDGVERWCLQIHFHSVRTKNVWHLFCDHCWFWQQCIKKWRHIGFWLMPAAAFGTSKKHCTVSNLLKRSDNCHIPAMNNEKEFGQSGACFLFFFWLRRRDQPHGFVKHCILHFKLHNVPFIGRGFRSFVAFLRLVGIAFRFLEDSSPQRGYTCLSEKKQKKKTAPRPDKDHPLNLTNANLTINVLFVRMMCNSELFPDPLSPKHSSSGPFNPPGIVNENSPWVSGP